MPSFGHEYKRELFLCRSGESGPGSTKTIRYGKDTKLTMQQTRKKAEKWVEAARKAAGF